MRQGRNRADDGRASAGAADEERVALRSRRRLLGSLGAGLLALGAGCTSLSSAPEDGQSGGPGSAEDDGSTGDTVDTSPTATATETEANEAEDFGRFEAGKEELGEGIVIYLSPLEEPFPSGTVIEAYQENAEILAQEGTLTEPVPVGTKIYVNEGSEIEFSVGERPSEGLTSIESTWMNIEVTIDEETYSGAVNIELNR